MAPSVHILMLLPASNISTHNHGVWLGQQLRVRCTMTQNWRWFGVGDQRSVADDPTLTPTPHQRESTHATNTETKAVAAFIRG
jgi:hypothetical protein